MTASEAIKACFSKWKTFDGRASRSEYWWFVGFIALVAVILSLLDGAIFGFPAPNEEPTQPLSAVFNLIVFLPSLAVLVRRLHDIGKSGWYALLPSALGLIFVVSGILVGIGAGNMPGNGMGASPEMGGMALPAAFMLLGMTGAFVATALALLVLVLMLYWLTRPGDEGANQYGPRPEK